MSHHHDYQEARANRCTLNFFFDSSVGGQDLRSVTQAIADKPHWGQSFTGAFGALFIEFNVGGDPNKAGFIRTAVQSGRPKLS